MQSSRSQNFVRPIANRGVRKDKREVDEPMNNVVWIENERGVKESYRVHSDDREHLYLLEKLESCEHFWVNTKHQLCDGPCCSSAYRDPSRLCHHVRAAMLWEETTLQDRSKVE